jgi:predicted ATPase/DNA-binding SARP family transcriptional activator
MPRIAIDLLGPLQIRIDGAPAGGFESDKVRALLVYLAAEPDRPHRRGALAGLLWPERSDRAALLNLNQALANLRRAIGDRDAAVPLLLVTREAIQLSRAAGCTVDLAAFTALAEACETHAHRDAAGCAPCAERLQAAIALYRGPFLAQFAPRDCAEFQEWALVLRERAHRQMLAALEQLAAYHVRRGAAADALEVIFRQIELDPWREEAYRLAMRLLWRDGQRSAALAQYERCRAVLEAELGLEPDDETTALYEQIRDAELRIENPEGTVATSPHAETFSILNSQLTPFVGREPELAQLAEYLNDPACRLVTIVGLGGSGKTRLAMQCAEAQQYTFADGVCVVPLAAARSAATIAPAIAQRLGMALGAEDPIEQLGAALRGKRTLLLLDNLEQLEGAGAVIAALLDQAPELAVLATSRERLGLRGEWALDLAGLPVPADATAAALDTHGATALFLQTARRARAGFAPDAAARGAIVRICRALGGHPLGIELAAAWAHVLTCAEIEAELGASLELLASSAHDLPERHRTIRAVFDSSWRLLTEDERQALRRLSIFRGGFDRAAGAQVAGAALARLAGLLNRSLLARGPGGRFELHEFVRQYAGEQLRGAGEFAEVAGRHIDYYCALVEQADQHMKTPEEAAWMDRLEQEHDNLRAAIERALALPRIEQAAAIGAVLRWFWYIRGHIGEGREWIERALSAADAAGASLPPRVRARLCQGAGIFADEQGAYAQAEVRYAEAVALFRELGDTKGVQAVTNSMGMLAWAQGWYAQAQERFETSLRLCRELGHTYGIANSLNSLGTVVQAQNDTATALACYAEALDHARAVGYEQLVTLILDNIGEAALARGDLARARASFHEALARQQASTDPRGAALSLQGLGMVALAEGDLEQAAQRLYQGLNLSWQSANRRDLTLYLGNLAALLLAQGHAAEAARLCGAAEAFRARIGSPLTPFERVGFDATVAGARARLGGPAFDRAWAVGAATPLDRIADEVLEAGLAPA